LIATRDSRAMFRTLINPRWICNTYGRVHRCVCRSYEDQRKRI